MSKEILKIPKTPEHNKCHAQTGFDIHQFLELLSSKGIVLCLIDPKTDRYYPLFKSNRELVFEFFDVDANKWEEEDQALLEYMRKLNKIERTNQP